MVSPLSGDAEPSSTRTLTYQDLECEESGSFLGRQGGSHTKDPDLVVEPVPSC